MNKINWSLKITTFTLLFFGLGFVGQSAAAEEFITDPSELPDANAYKAVVKIKAFSSADGDNLYQYSEGSGIIISSDGVILTNYHVVTLEDEFDEGEYDSSYQICLPSAIDQAPDCHYAAKLIAKDKDQDVALLKIEPISGLSSQTSNFKYLNLATADNTAVNDTIFVMGFPAVGGDTITITRGIISGKEEKFYNKWIKTDAVISFGSSGGAAIDDQGAVIGLVNSAHADYIGSLGYLINTVSISDWVNVHKTVQSQGIIYLEDLKNFTKKQASLEDVDIFTNDYFSVTKPADWEFTYTHEYELSMDKSDDDEGGYLTIKMIKYPYEVSLDVALVAMKDSFTSMGVLGLMNFTKIENVLVNNQPAKKIVVSYAGNTETFYYLVNKNYLIELDYDYGSNDQDEDIIQDIMDSLDLNTQSSNFEAIAEYTQDLPKFSIKTGGDWHMLSQNYKTKPIQIYNDQNPNVYIEIQVEEGDENTKNYDNQEYLDHLKQLMEDVNNLSATTNLSIAINDENISYDLNDELTNVLMMDASAKKVSTDELLVRGPDYIIKTGDKRITVSFVMFGGTDSEYQAALADALENVIQTFSLTGTSNEAPASDEPEEPAEETANEETYTPPVAAGSLAQRLSGRILLQVEENGEAWYIRPDTKKRMYLKDGEAAYSLMRNMGLGITNADLQKIPIGIESRFECQDSDSDGLCDKLEDGLGTDAYDSDSDGDGHSDGTEVMSNYNPLGSGALSYDNSLISRLSGKIVLQVEAHGEAWYINPVDGKRYYMPDGPSAYQIMRYLSLGITNADLAKISED